jgi:hypothetical protein
VATTTVLYQDRVTSTNRARSNEHGLWVPLSELKALSGWEVKPEGVCKDEVCVPVPDARRHALIGDDELSLTEFARMIEQPVAHDEKQGVWYFGPPAWEWKSRLASRMAPDFALPDLSGQLHALSGLLGKKVLLLFWASW